MFLRLGLTSFGGPVAHLGYFREAFVTRRAWLTDAAYADLVALAQFLPGPASSQVGMALGWLRAGWGGLVAAWLAFTLPSALLMFAFALGVGRLGATGGWAHGLMLASVAVVAHAVVGMARTLTPDAPTRTLAVLSAAFTLLAPGPAAQLLLLLVAGLLGWRFLPATGLLVAADAFPVPRGARRVAPVLLGLFVALLVALPLLSAAWPAPALHLLSAFYRAGALVFGGGHVVLPLLEADVVRTGWVTPEAFTAGYGAAQAVPGPLFTFSAYLGASTHLNVPPALGALCAVVGIFLPSLLLVAGTLPYWATLRSNRAVRAALRGVNAAVVGLLLAALYTPVITGAVHAPLDVVLALAAFAVLVRTRVPAWAVVLGCALLGPRL